MIGYDPWHWKQEEMAERLCRRLVKDQKKSSGMWSSVTVTVTTNSTAPQVNKERDALIDIAHDCGSLEAAQRRAKEALK